MRMLLTEMTGKSGSVFKKRLGNSGYVLSKH